jgi:poly-gamma-glutamate capsule biosynthesis protein CapA/YwtB (metallophosphatase superfamily)
MKQSWFITGALVLTLLFLSGCAKKDSFSITFGGDVILARDGKPIIADWKSIDLSLPDASNDSLRNYYAANLESSLRVGEASKKANPEGEMNLCASNDELAMLSKSGFDILTFANNHQDDCIGNGAQITKDLISNAGFVEFDQHDGIWKATIPEYNLVVIAFNLVNSSVDETKLINLIKEQKEKENFVVLSVHWGNEYQAGPDKTQEDLAQKWVDAGADVIWGHHPHVLQRVDWMTSALDGHLALVMYSLGNLLTDQFMLPDAQRSALIRLTIQGNKIRMVTVFPVVLDWEHLRLNFAPNQEITEKIVDRLGIKTINSLSVEVYTPTD